MTAPVETDLKFFHCEERSSLPTNGGYLSTTEIATGAMNNVWPHVLRDEREAGSSLLRKLALKVHQDGDGSLATTEFCFDGPTLGQDRCNLFAAGAQDTEADVTGSERAYCAGGISTAVVSGSQTVIFDIKDAGDAANVQIGDDFRLTDKLTPTSGTGNVEYHEVAGKSVNSTTITLTTVDLITNDYAVYADGAGGKVGVIYPAGGTKAENDIPVITSSAGTIDDTTYPITFNNIGADEQELTFEFSDNLGNFTCASDRHGSLASGNISSDYSPLHPHWAKAMLTIPPDFWTGTWVSGDTVVIQFHAAAAYIWEQRDVPVDCAPMANNKVILVNRSEGL